MVRRIIHIAVLGACLAAALALAGSATASPSTPQLAPLPFYISADQQISWSASALDPDGLPGLTSYKFQLVDLTAGGATTTTFRPWTLPTTAKLDALFPNVTELHEYVLCVSTVEVTSSYDVLFSFRTCDHFKVMYSIGDLRRLLDKYISINPDPGCIVCGPDLRRYAGDPEIAAKIGAGLSREPSPITGIAVDARGGVAIVTG